jgi:Flp pilus assembly protein CpaB
MNTHRITAMAMAVALAGFAHTLAAEENILTIPADDMLQQDISEQKPETDILVSEFEMPAQTVSQPADNLLSDLKVYPSF